MTIVWRVIVLVTLVNFTAIMGIRAQDEHYPIAESVLFPPEGCEMPCFLGIQMGVTRADEAIAILEAHPYVGDVQEVGAGDRQVSSVRWYWAEDAPRFLTGFRTNVLELDYATEIVNGITLYVFIPTGDVWRYVSTRETAQGKLLSDYIRVDGQGCSSNILSYYQSIPQRIFYDSSPSPQRPPYKPHRTVPRALQC